MRIISILILYFFLSVPLLLIAQSRNEELLDWDANRRLTWADYKAKPDQDSDAAASTASVLAVSYGISSAGFTYKIECRFSKTRSWGLHKTDYILSHEQGHFDIAEIYARKLHQRMSAYRFNKNNYQKELNRIYNEVADEKAAFQQQYDRETRHSIDEIKQAEWLKKISRMLEELKEYADY